MAINHIIKEMDPFKFRAWYSDVLMTYCFPGSHENELLKKDLGLLIFFLPQAAVLHDILKKLPFSIVRTS